MWSAIYISSTLILDVSNFHAAIGRLNCPENMDLLYSRHFKRERATERYVSLFNLLRKKSAVCVCVCVLPVHIHKVYDAKRDRARMLNSTRRQFCSNRKC